MQDDPANSPLAPLLFAVFNSSITLYNHRAVITKVCIYPSGSSSALTQTSANGNHNAILENIHSTAKSYSSRTRLFPQRPRTAPSKCPRAVPVILNDIKWNASYSRSATYLFQRFTKDLRTQLIDYVPAILDSIREFSMTSEVSREWT